MELKIFQKGFNYSQDGPGNRLVYHLQGCNMSCPWCANPEGMKAQGCTIYSPTSSKKSFLVYSVEDLIDEITCCRPMFFDGGGVTFTGGEPTLQFEALKELLVRLKLSSIHTAIESNASHPRFPELWPYLDYIIMDCKQCDESLHIKYTGISNRTSLSNIRLACESGKPVHIRVPLIHHVNDSTQDRKMFLTFFQTLSTQNVTFEFLSYHEFGKAKWESCHMDYQMEDGFIDSSTLTDFKKDLISCGLTYKET